VALLGLLALRRATEGGGRLATSLAGATQKRSYIAP
jgi:hypothetical protein